MFLIRGGTIYTMESDVPLKGYDILVGNGKIREIAKNLTHSGAKTINARNMFIYPGMVDIHTHLGIYEENVGWAGADGNEATEPVTPHLRALDAINPDDPAFKDAYANGITTVNIFPGSANIIGGLGVAMKTYGKEFDKRIIKQPSGLKMALGENPKRVYGERKMMPMTRLGNAAVMRSALIETKEYLKNKDKKGFDLKWEAIAGVIEDKYPARIHSHRADDIITAIRIMKEFEIDFAIEHCTEGHLIADFLREHKAKCALGPSISTRIKQELKNINFKTAGIFEKNNILFGFVTDAPVIPIYTLPLEASLAVREGLSEAEALKALTINGALILRAADRIGSIKKGKDADIFIADRPVLDPLHRVIYTFIDGDMVFHLKDGEYPVI